MKSIIKSLLKQPLRKLLYIVLLTGCGKIVIDEDISRFYFPSLRFYQSMAFSAEKACFVTPDGPDLILDVYRLEDGQKEASVSMPLVDGYVPHANASCFSGDFYSDRSFFPLLYVSSWGGERKAFVYDISKDDLEYKSSLVQVINPIGINEEVLGSGNLNWTVDIDNSRLYAVAYELPNSALIKEGNSLHITCFDLPKVESNVFEVFLTDSDVIDNRSLPVINAFQDMFIDSGKLFIASGFPSVDEFFENKLFVIDLDSYMISEKKLSIIGEPEGFCFYGGSYYLYMDGWISGHVYNVNL